jgi:exopolysaccharide biosynthesis polyprenyl glycosylphosphotransferase
MSGRSSQAVGTGTQAQSTVAHVPAAVRADNVWTRRRVRGWRFALLRRMLACADLSAAFLASLSLVLLGDGGAAQLAWSLVYLPVWILVAKLLGLYDRDGRTFRHLTVDEAPAIVLWALIGTSGLSFFLGLTPVGRPDAGRALGIGVGVALSAFLLRGSARLLWRAVTPLERVAILGAGASADAIRRKLELFPDAHMNVVAVRDSIDLDGIQREGLPASVDRLIVAPSSLDDDQVQMLHDLARDAGTKLSLVPPCQGAFGTAVRLDHIAELPVLEFNTGDISRSTLLLKRILDVVVGAAALVLLLPLFALIAIAIRLDSRGPVVFSHWRAGQNGRPFQMLKFRTMVANAEELLTELVAFDTLPEPMFKLADDPRVTRVGRSLRRWSLDELLQLFNVVKGEMSLVGPRPEQVDLVERYSPEQRRRLELKPGLTGPMQVYGRGALSLGERLAVERDYIENLSLGRDVRILAMTAAAVFRGGGAF